nr:hypothetical protein [Tanacetum cinerariifolium]
AKPTEKHLKEVKRIFCYLRETVNTGLWYSKDSDFELTGFSDADYAGCKDTFKSTSGGAQFLGKNLLTDYGFHFNKILIYCDSKSAIAISCNPVQHSRTKHITVHYHFIKEHVEKGTIELYFVKTDYQLADLFTKALLADRFNYLVRRLVIRQPNAFKSQRPSVLGKPTTFSNSFIRKAFSKSTSVTKNNVSNDFSKPVTAQTLPTKKKSCLKNTNVLTPGMYKIHTDHTQARTSKLPQDSKKTNKRVSFSTGVIPTTSVSKPQLKSNPHGDRVLRSNSRGKTLEVEEHRRNVKLSKNKTFVTACNNSLNAKTLNVKSVSAVCAKCVMIDKHDLCVPKSVAKPLKKTVASDSNKKPRNNVRKLHERFGKIYTWSYIKFTPSGYIWKPKSKQGNVNPNVSMPLGNASRTANVKDTMTSRRSIVLNTLLSSNSFAAHRDCSIH